MNETAHTSVEQERRDKRDAFLARGVDPYPAAVVRTHSLAEIRDAYEHLEPNVITEDEVTIAGRVMFFRTSGKIAFATLQEGDGTRLQLMLPADALGAHALATNAFMPPVPEGQDQSDPVSVGKALIKDFDRMVDLGDFITASGVVATSIKGELSVRVSAWTMASKGIRALPFLHADLSDEVRVRQPYLELIQSQDARDRVRARSRIIREVRHTFEDWNFIEVETPVLQPIHGGANARPFTTHVNALDQEFSLRIALELPLKKSVVGGLERVFSMGPIFRNEGIDSSHSPEFQMLESYLAYSDMYGVAELTQNVIRRVCAQVAGSETSPYELVLDDGTVLNFGREWRWLSVYDGVSTSTGTCVTADTGVDTLQSLCRDHGVSFDPSWPAGKLVMELCSELVEPGLIQPTFLHDWPAEAQPLARRNPEDPRRILAWDLIINGVELGTGFTELVDPVIQREVLTAQSLAAANGDEEAMVLDEDFLRALSYGCPPMGGMGLGLDRLVMLFTQTNIREAILFPLVRREEF